MNTIYGLKYCNAKGKKLEWNWILNIRGEHRTGHVMLGHSPASARPGTNMILITSQDDDDDGHLQQDWGMVKGSAEDWEPMPISFVMSW